MNNYKYHAIKKDVSSPSYMLYILIQDNGQTADMLIEKSTITGNVTEKTYYESNEAVETISAAWTARASKTYVEKTDFKGEF